MVSNGRTQRRTAWLWYWQWWKTLMKQLIVVYSVFVNGNGVGIIEWGLCFQCLYCLSNLIPLPFFPRPTSFNQFTPDLKFTCYTNLFSTDCCYPLFWLCDFVGSWNFLRKSCGHLTHRRSEDLWWWPGFSLANANWFLLMLQLKLAYYPVHVL